MQVNDELASIVDLSMPFPARVIRAYVKLPNRKKYQKNANAKTFNQWLSDLMRLAIKPIKLQ
ncbi:MAG: hypothetical protein QXJ19_04580 [Candidatus Bathyarchaeia archaeon]